MAKKTKDTGRIDLLVTNAALITAGGASAAPKKKEAMNDIGLIDRGTVAVRDGIITYVGPADPATEAARIRRWRSRGLIHIDAQGAVVMPGLVDPHTHLVFAGSRAHEYAARITGEKYEEQTGEGHGILYTVGRTRQARKEELFYQAWLRLTEAVRYGTTTIEVKSGYGLDYENEMKILEAIKKLKETAKLIATVVPTFLGAHTVPPEFRDNRRGYRDILIEILRKVRRDDLAGFCDVFCDRLGFSLEESEFILIVARSLGFRLKAHIDQTGESGGRQLLNSFPFVSVDHLDYLSLPGKLETNTVGVLLPGVTYHLMETEKQALWPDKVRDFLKAGLPVALATDYNPGSCPCLSMQTIMELAARLYRMNPAEIINAATINAAHALGLGREIGSIEPGKKADMIICNVRDWREMIDNFGTNKVKTVIKEGRIVAENK